MSAQQTAAIEAATSELVGALGVTSLAVKDQIQETITRHVGARFQSPSVAQPIDPRAWKAARQFRAEVIGLTDESTEQLARIIQSHFAESVNGKLLEAAKALIGGKWNHLCSDGIGGCNAISEALLSNLEEAIALAQSQPPSMADELAEALRDALVELNPETRASSQRSRGIVSGLESVLSRYDAQKGQS